MTRKQKSERANSRRKLFNSEKPHCPKCGSLTLVVFNLHGLLVAKNACPLSACPK